MAKNSVTSSELINKNDHLPQLPTEVLIEIFKHLDVESLRNVSRLTKRLSDISLYCVASNGDLRALDDEEDVSRVIAHLQKRKDGIRELHFPDQRYNHEDITKIEQIIKMNADSLTTVTLPPLNWELVQGRFLDQVLCCKKLKEFNICGKHIDSHKKKYWNRLRKENQNRNLKLQHMVQEIILGNSLEHFRIENWGVGIINMNDIIQTVFMPPSQLKTFSCAGTGEVHPIALSFISWCEQLTDLNIDWAVTTDPRFKSNFRLVLPNLRRLSLCGFKLGTEQNLANIFKNSKNLKEVRIQELAFVDHAEPPIKPVSTCLTELDHLDVLDITGCGIPPSMVEEFREDHKSVLIIDDCIVDRF